MNSSHKQKGRKNGSQHADGNGTYIPLDIQGHLIHKHNNHSVSIILEIEDEKDIDKEPRHIQNSERVYHFLLNKPLIQHYTPENYEAIIDAQIKKLQYYLNKKRKEGAILTGALGKHTRDPHGVYELTIRPKLKTLKERYPELIFIEEL